MSLDVFDVYAKLTLDTSEYDRSIDDAKDEANVFAGVLSGNLATKGIGLAIKGLKELGEVAVDTFKKAIDGYAEFEQLSGGIETLFKDSADTIKSYAEDAYKTTGLSANEYMKSITAFSASMIQSTGRVTQTNLDELEKSLDSEYLETKRHLEDQYDQIKDYWDKRIKLEDNSIRKEKLSSERDEELKSLKRSTEDQLAALKEHNKAVLEETEKANKATVSTGESIARAAELSDMAMRDIADNASKFGVYTTQELAGVYQSLSKGMYQTLDNLSLGFSGTKQGLQDLIDKANEVRGSNDLTIDSFADIVEAIHTVQEEMGITGTAANESSGTISGSIEAVKATWKNLIANLGNDKADISKLIDDLYEAAKTAWHNIEPVAKQVLDGVINMIIEGLPKFVDLGFQIAGAILKGIALSPLKLLGKVMESLGLISGQSSSVVHGDRNYVPTAYSSNASVYVPTVTTASGESIAAGASWQTQEFYDSLRGGVTININGDVNDDERSMREKMRTAVRDVIDEELAHG